MRHTSANTNDRVLSVGGNPELLSLRDAVLKSAGFNVLSTLSVNDAIAKIMQGDCGVLLMWYSLSPDHMEKLSDVFRQKCPRGRVIAITNEEMRAPHFADSFVYGIEGPEVLIEALQG